MAHGRRGEGVVHRQLAQPRDARREPRGAPTPGGRQAEREAHPVEARRDDLLGAHVGVGAEAVAEDAGGGAIGHATDPAIVLVQDRDAVARQRLHELALGLLDGRDRAHPAQVDALHRRHHADLRASQARQVRDLAPGVHAHLEDHGAVIRAEPEERERQPDLVVLVALRTEGPELRPEDRRDRLLRRGLGDAAGHADDERREPGAPAGGEGAERHERVLHGQHGHVAEGVEDRGGNGPRDDQRGGAGDGGCREIAMTVGALAGQRHEQLAGEDDA
jgi:hypothetical protein